VAGLINFTVHDEDDNKDEWELSLEQVMVGEELGKGAFGVVRKGWIEGPLWNKKVKVQFRNATQVEAAIKMLSGKQNKTSRTLYVT